MPFPDQYSLEQFLLEEFDGYDRVPYEMPTPTPKENNVAPGDGFILVE